MARLSKTNAKAQFIDVTQAKSSVATRYLEQADWNVEEALREYYNENPPYDPKLENLFDKYMDPENHDLISIDGTLAYLNDLGIDPEEVLSLIVAYVLKSPQTGEFRRNSFVQIWSSLSINTIDGMRSFLLEKENTMETSVDEFEPFYQFVFEFVRGSDSRIKVISSEEAIIYWQMLLDKRFPKSTERLQQWYEFVQETKKSITRDSWNMFFKFLVQVIEKDPSSLSGYDEASAWPSLVDEYIEWLEESGKLQKGDDMSLIF
ncbi:hypothetical_protein [Candidozyma auris]|uniref:NEDD8 ligase DCN1 n=1 Tax=Candidozyma auris TaxID=498019 RepID=UPI000D2ED271|nr:NEDD8 ligase DCN1 [[Candida] auris]QEO21217.1 hypothetical_protein [[Candida] auris]GBL48274.1 hypothetical protein CAJCM15448_05480 [[Candida] auris]